jgi:predicted NBD/HSP70 family sugar kinase
MTPESPDLPARAARPGIGVDVGGSGVRATAFEVGPAGELRALRAAERRHEDAALVATILDVVREVRGALAMEAVPVGIAAPGRKTADLRGIEQARNLAPAPRLLEELEVAAPGGLRLPLALASDADAALVGETVVEEGLLRGEDSALLVSPGSGVAEAWLWRGELRPVEGPRAWELPPVEEGGAAEDLEREGSLSGLFQGWSGRQPIEWAAAEGHPEARAALERLARALARLVEERGPRLAALAREAGAPPAVLVRSRRGTFFQHATVGALVRPILEESVRRHGARLVLPTRPASPHAACAGALTLGDHPGGRP